MEKTAEPAHFAVHGIGFHTKSPAMGAWACGNCPELDKVLPHNAEVNILRQQLGDSSGGYQVFGVRSMPMQFAPAMSFA